MPYLRFALLCLIWGGSFLLMKRAAAGMSPLTMAAGRALIGVVILGALWGYSRRRAGRTLTRSQLPAVFGVMLLGYALPYYIQPLFISKTQSSSLGAMGIGFTPLFTVAFSVPMLGIRPTARQFAGVAGSLGCLALLLADSAQRNITIFDMLLLFSVPLMYALANNWMRLSLADVPPMELTAVCLGLSGLLLLAAAWLSGDMVRWSSPNLISAFVALAIMGVFSTGLGMLMFNQLVQEQGPLFAAMVTNLTPIGALLLGWADAEHVTGLQLAALAGVLVCVVVVQWGAATRSEIRLLDPAKPQAVGD